MKEKIIEMYKAAAVDVFKAMPRGEYGAEQREIFAEMYGRRQAYARVLEEVFGVPSHELQAILDELHNKGMI